MYKQTEVFLQKANNNDFPIRFGGYTMENIMQTCGRRHSIFFFIHFL